MLYAVPAALYPGPSAEDKNCPMSAPRSSTSAAVPSASPAPAFLQGGGEVGALMRAHDWRSSSLGQPSLWPAPLQTALGVILNTGHPMYVWWGRELLCFYNDAYRQSIGPERHPGSLGRPGREVREAIWDIIGPQIDQVMSGGGATWHENALLPITRNGRREELQWTYSCSPIVDPASPTGVAGVLMVCAETTARGSDGAVNGIIVEGVDVTSRTLSDAERRDSEEQLRLATEAAEVGLWDVDVESDRLFWPPRVKAMFGISADRAVSMRDDFYPCLHPDDRDRVSEAFAAALDPRRRALYDVEYRTIGKEDGVIRWVAAKGRGVYEGDRCRRVIGTAIDITPRKAAEAELQILNERLEQRVSEILAEKQAAEAHMRQAQKLEALGQLTGGVAHDFNNLLMIIKGGLSLLRRPQVEAERRHKVLSSMEQAVDRGATLSRQLLAFARRQPLRAESVDLRLHIEGMRELLDRSLRGDVQVRTEFEPCLWPVEIDPAQLELVILNLCVNARDAMPNGGVITIEAKNRSAMPHAGATGEFVALSVADPGTGMSPEVLEHVFEPFYTTKEIGKGSGLGLPQVHGFAQQSGGSVRIESKVGEGTKVTLLLPRAQSAAVPVSAALLPQSAARGAESMGSVLLVEDDNEVAALVSEMLRELGYRITRAASAQAALGALANDREIDIVLSDVMMPGEKNGLDLAAEVTRRRPNLKVVLTTGYAGGAISSVDKDMQVHVLRKPYDIRTLELALRAVRGR